jgi:hypothetical protein
MYFFVIDILIIFKNLAFWWVYCWLMGIHMVRCEISG